MATLTLRLVKGSALTWQELDNNFSNINTEVGTKLGGTAGTSGHYARWDGSGDLVDGGPFVMDFALSSVATDLTTGTSKLTWRAPFAMTITDVRASVATAPVGANIIVDINIGGTTIMTTNKLSIDAQASGGPASHNII